MGPCFNRQMISDITLSWTKEEDSEEECFPASATNQRTSTERTRTDYTGYVMFEIFLD